MTNRLESDPFIPILVLNEILQPKFNLGLYNPIKERSFTFLN